MGLCPMSRSISRVSFRSATNLTGVESSFVFRTLNTTGVAPSLAGSPVLPLTASLYAFVGGIADSGVWLLDLDAKSWTAGTALCSSSFATLARAAALKTGDGTVLFMGGEDITGKVVDDVWTLLPVPYEEEFSKRGFLG